MSNELPKAYDPSVIEERWAKYWVSEHLFDVATPASPEDVGKPFTMLLPPPNVTGRLHMGHMLNQAEMDILTRWHRMRGETSLWVPGTDHAGIATQMMVERQLEEEGKTRQELGRERFREAGVGVEVRVRRRDSGPDEAAGRERGLEPRVLHDGRAAECRGEGGVRTAVGAGADLSRGVHRELGPGDPDGGVGP